MKKKKKIVEKFLIIKCFPLKKNSFEYYYAQRCDCSMSISKPSFFDFSKIFSGANSASMKKSCNTIQEKTQEIRNGTVENSHSTAKAIQTQQQHESLPTEVLLHIFSFLDGSTLTRASQTCRQWKAMVDNEEQLWRSLFIKEWPWLNLTLFQEKLWRIRYRDIAVAEQRRLAFEPYKYLISSISHRLHPSWEDISEDDFAWAFHQNGVYLRNGVIFVYINGYNQQIGHYRFVRLHDARKKFASMPAIFEEIGCRYNGTTCGFFNFEFESNKKFGEGDLEETDFISGCRYFLVQLMRAARGMIGRVDTGYVDRCVILKDFTMTHAFSKFGLTDGSSLLNRNPQSQYIKDILANANDLVKQVNNSSETYVVSTTHNPLRIESTLPEGSFDEIIVPIWVYNFDALMNKRLFNFTM